MIAGQVWARISKPTGLSGYAWDSGYAAIGELPQVRLFWNNQHPRSGQYHTEIWEGPTAETASWVRESPNTATAAYLHDSPTDTTRRFWLRHTADPSPELPQLDIAVPNSPFAGLLDVYVPPELRALITGPDGIERTGSYQWNSNPSGGIPAYGFRWFYQRIIPTGSVFDLGVNSQILTKWVKVKSSLWAFRLIVTLDDYPPTAGHYNADSADMFIVVVVDEGGPGGPGLLVAAQPNDTSSGQLGLMQRLALLDERDRCVRVPQDQRERQRFFRRLWETNTGFTRCDQPLLPR